MRPVRKYQPPWLAGFLFPFKVYVVLAVIAVIAWHAMLPDKYSDARQMEGDTFNVMTDLLKQGYFVSAVVLITGGLIQLLRNSERAALWSIAFGLAALVIVGCFLNYVDWSPMNGFGVLRQAAR